MIRRLRGLNRRVIRVEAADHVLDLLVRDHAADKQDVRPLIVELPRHEPVGRVVEVGEVRHDRQHAGSREAERLEVVPVELRVAEREVAPIDVGVDFAPAPEALSGQRAVHGRRSTRAA